jgi:hypothetical protein
MLLVLAGLCGCATGYLLDNSVQTFAGAAAMPANPSYRFERLPSQQASPAQSQLEAMADPALFKAGFRRDDRSAQYSVLLSARVRRVMSPWADPWDGWGGGWGSPWGGGVSFMGPGVGFGFGGPFPRMDQPWFQREVGVVVRELAGNRVVYETRATSDGPWGDSTSVLPAMFEAALQGFPNAPAGVRRVDIQVGK